MVRHSKRDYLNSFKPVESYVPFKLFLLMCKGDERDYYKEKKEQIK